jgi:hypothetical protein
MSTTEIQKEASRILGNISRMAGYHDTTTTAVVDYICENYGMTVLCNGLLRKIVFTPTTNRNFSFKTEPV